MFWMLVGSEYFINFKSNANLEPIINAEYFIKIEI